MILSNDGHGELSRQRIDEELARHALVHHGFDNDAGGNKLWQQVQEASPRAEAIMPERPPTGAKDWDDALRAGARGGARTGGRLGAGAGPKPCAGPRRAQPRLGCMGGGDEPRSRVAPHASTRDPLWYHWAIRASTCRSRSPGRACGPNRSAPAHHRRSGGAKGKGTWP